MDTTYTEKTSPGPRATADRARIPGWGADLDHAHRPAYPMERTPPRLEGAPQEPPRPQVRKAEILRSNERPGLTPVFGTASPPSGISGWVRRAAFRFSENDLRHWLLLLFADRVNVGEGVASDLAHGHLPNIYREMGGPAEWRHNRPAALRKVAVAGAIVLVAVYLWRRD